MNKHRQTEVRFSLKDELFNPTKVKKLSTEIKAVHPAFNKIAFDKAVLTAFPEQELMERIRGIRDQLRAFLPKEYKQALDIILKALPPELDPKKTDNDFGDFIYSPYTYFVATYGCTEKNVHVSLRALQEMTKRFSAEGALRDFLNAFPKETLAIVEQWSKDNNYHVRRLASEGTRPFLPWAKKITIAHKKLAPILDRLHTDSTRYVTRSVANHLNDIAKVEPKLVITLLKKWQKAKKQQQKELDFITHHALRTLIKQGNSEALVLIGYSSTAIEVKSFKIKTPEVRVGESLEFSFKLISESEKSQDVLIDYIVHFKKANGTLAPKTHKIGKRKLEAKETLLIEKTHPMRLMSTRTLYSGEHHIELQINGQSLGKKKFMIL